MVIASSILFFQEGSVIAREPVQPEDIEITMALPAYPIKIYTGPGEYGTTSIKVPLTIVKPMEAISDTVTLDLWSLTEEEDLEVTIEPEQVVFPPDSNRSRDFEIDIDFHYDPLHKTSYIIGRFYIEGIWRYTTLPKNGRMTTEGGEVDIIPFLMTETIAKEGTDRLEAEVGAWNEIYIEVQNRGNAQVSVKVEAVYTPEDLDLYVNTPTLVINPFGNETAHLKIRQSSGEGRDSTVNVRFTTKYLDRTETDEVPILLHTETKEEPVVSDSVLVIIGIFVVLAGLLVITIIVFLKERRSKG